MSSGSPGSKLDDIVLDALDAHQVRLGAYIADHMLDRVTDRLKDSPTFQMLTVAREDEGLGILAGAYLGGRRGAIFMQSSGFALCLNALGSVLLPYHLPVVMFVGLRGGIGEFNVAQLAGGMAVRPVCAAIGVPYLEPRSVDEFGEVLSGLMFTAFATGRPVCVGLTRNVLQ